MRPSQPLQRPFASIAVLALVLHAAPSAAAGTLFVNASQNTGADNGASWSDAFQGVAGLQNALAAATSGDELWVAQGTYLPTSTGNRAISFALKTGVAIYGGFVGNETLLAQRDPAAHETILSADLNGDDGSSSFGENSFHVINGNSVASSAIVDGFTISGGNANGSSAGNQDRGGGMLMVAGSNPTIARCVVKNNRCTFGGGAGYLLSSSPSFTDTRFESNTGGSFGGVFDMGGSVASLIDRCVFIGNSAARAGAVEVFGSSAPKITNCLFYGNTSTGSGGGGAIFISGSAPQIRNCTIVGNNSTVNAAAGVLQTGAGASLGNSIVYFNNGPGGAQGSANQVSGLAAGTTWCCVQGGIAGSGNISADPLLVNIGGGDFHLSSASPCIDAGNNGLVPSGIALDLGMNPRFVDDPAVADTGAGGAPIVDMGAHEAPNTLYSSFCIADGTLATACPCGNIGQLGRGCANSVDFSIGALETATGTANPDTVVLIATDVLPSALSIFLQGDAQTPTGIVFGDGVRCVSGHLKRLSSKNAVSGVVSYPQAGDLSITARSAQLGDTILPGSMRYYQTYYRDPNLAFCPSPAGNTWNVTNAIAVQW
jgi:hypothetical protein